MGIQLGTNRSQTGMLAVIAIVALTATGCGSKSSGSGKPLTTLVGAGSTFVYPLVSQWTADYKARAGVTVTYGAVGSGAGIAAVTDRSVDFGASDAPLSPDQQTACNGCVQIPWALGATSIAYHLDGAPAHLRLSGPVIANIFLGKITTWNDAAIAKLNPGVSLPATPISPVVRSDASGTSYNFTDYLSQVSPEWKARVSASTQPSFPTGTGAKGSSGVAGVIASTNGAIGYVDVAYAETNHFQYAAVENAAGSFVLPTVPSIAAAAAATRGADSIVDPPASAPNAYPISTFTYVIVPRQTANATPLRAFLNYAVTTGQRFGPKLLFAPLPANVVMASKRAIATIS